MKRRFNKRQKRILAWVAAGACQMCGIRLQKNFHADHVTAFSRGGKTINENGQALCSGCNLKKGNK